MKTEDWSDLLDYDDDEESSCLAQMACVEDLLRDEPDGCLYCRLSDLAEGDDE